MLQSLKKSSSSDSSIRSFFLVKCPVLPNSSEFPWLVGRDKEKPIFSITNEGREIADNSSLVLEVDELQAPQPGEPFQHEKFLNNDIRGQI